MNSRWQASPGVRYSKFEFQTEKLAVTLYRYEYLARLMNSIHHNESCDMNLATE